MNRNMKENFKVNFPEILKQKQKKQSDISRDLNIPYTTVSNWYLGKKFPRPDKMQMLADYLSVNVEDLVLYKEPHKKVHKKIVIDKMIKKHLSLRGWTTQELADKLGEDESIILGCMAGSLQPKMGTVQKLADLFEITTDELVYGSDDDIDPTLTPSNITSLEEAVQITLNNPSVAFYGGYDVDKLSDQEKIDFANWIADSIKFYAQRFGK